MEGAEVLQLFRDTGNKSNLVVKFFKWDRWLHLFL